MHERARCTAARRAYQVPRLQVIGDVRSLTTAVGAHGKKDGPRGRRTGY
ncbi:MAG TPA: hypothetical protein VG818_00550 [Gemmatimonadaceae bacterium]|nr:hypothetical protein [Gemmatimonadaceae bacterium]